MSQTQSVTTEERSVGTLERELPDGRSASVEVFGNPANPSRVDVEVCGGRRWLFGINADVGKLVLVLNADGQRVDPELPGWIEPLVRQVGLEGVEE